jgi:hypothetical protein
VRPESRDEVRFCIVVFGRNALLHGCLRAPCACTFAWMSSGAMHMTW